MSGNRTFGARVSAGQQAQPWAGLEAMEPRLLLSTTFYLSTTSLESGLVPTPVNPEVSVEVGQSVTLYLWASMTDGTSPEMGWDFVESNSAAVAGTGAAPWGGRVGTTEYGYEVYRWGSLGWTAGMDGDAIGFTAKAVSSDVYCYGLTSTYRTTDPSVRGSASPYQYYVGSVSFTGMQVGQTDIFLTVNNTRMYGDSGMIGTPGAGALKIGAGEASYAPVSDDGGTYYVAPGVTGALADATITVVPSSSTRPTIGSLTTNPELLGLDTFTLTAGGVSDSDGTVADVRFYWESNGIAGLQVGKDFLAGTDTNGADGWSLVTSLPAFKPGDYPYYVQATDNDGKGSSVGALAPSYVVHTEAGLKYALTANPQSVTRPDMLTLSAENPEGWMYWARQLGTSADDSSSEVAYTGPGKSVAVDAAGNIFLAGSTKGALGGENAGGSDVFIAKYDSGGSLVWVRQFGTSSTDGCGGIALDPNGNVLLTGTTQGVLGASSAGMSDIFTAKYDTDGNLLWIQQIGGARADVGGGVATDAAGNVLITGRLGLGTDWYNIHSDVFVAKYDAAGNLMWQTNFGEATKDDYGNGIATDADGNAYVTGHSYRAGYKAFLSKFDAAGNQLWKQEIGGAFAYGVTTDAAGAILVTGSTQSSSIGGTGAGLEDMFLLKYDSAGNQAWARKWGTTAADYGYNLTTDGENNIFVGGLTKFGTVNSSSVLAKYDAQGNLFWTQTLGTALIERKGDVALAPDGTPYFAGVTEGSIGALNAGSSDVFLVRMAEPESVSFYRGSNATQGLQAGGDTLLATDPSGADGWSAAVSTAGMGADTYAFYAQGADSEWGASLVMSAGVTVTMVVKGDVNGDGLANALDISGFVDALTSGGYQHEADCNEDRLVNALDISGFVNVLTGGGGAGDAVAATASQQEIVANAVSSPVIGVTNATVPAVRLAHSPLADNAYLPVARAAVAMLRSPREAGVAGSIYGSPKHAAAWDNMAAGAWAQELKRGRGLVVDNGGGVDVLAMLG